MKSGTPLDSGHRSALKIASPPNNPNITGIAMIVKVLIYPLGLDIMAYIVFASSILVGLIKILDMVWNRKIINHFGMEGKPNKLLKISEIVQFLYRPLIDQCKEELLPKAYLRLVIGSWSLTCIIFIGVYRGNLVKSLTTGIPREWPQTFEQIAKINDDSLISSFNRRAWEQVRPILTSEIENSINRERRENLGEIFRKVSIIFNEAYRFAQIEQILKMRDGKIHFIGFHYILDILTTVFERKYSAGNPFHLSEDSIEAVDYWVVQSHPLDKIVLNKFSWLQDAGIFKEMNTLVYLRRAANSRQQMKEQLENLSRQYEKAKGHKLYEQENYDGPKILKLKHTQYVFAVVTFGCIPSLLLFIVELLTKMCHNPVYMRRFFQRNEFKY
ncbi:unnamed protein product [Orchesella dallaii]|uniref:Uncharacterized protein n=1 Tax=Orchesella dallaii TaxID=48710 RepID=A0ABP1RQ89_9HEXA